jgi:adenosylcobinamide-phosphate synthase
MQISFVAPLLAGYILDLLLGDPERFPHPVKLFGRIIAAADIFFNRGKYVFLKGMITAITLISGVYFFFYLCGVITNEAGSSVNIIFNIVFVYYGLANKNLIDEGWKVFASLSNGGVEEARKALARIVGRDTVNLSENKIRIAVLETMSENLNDGVIAPLFFYAVGGVPAMMAYKMVNTLDSMIGYKSKKYFWFGKTAARIDDIANYIPARTTALLIAASELSLQSIKFIFKYGRAHASPNSAYPEAALAGAINARFGGPNYYGGKLVEKPYIGCNDREIENKEFYHIAMINHKAVIIFIAIIIGINAL